MSNERRNKVGTVAGSAALALLAASVALPAPEARAAAESVNGADGADGAIWELGPAEYRGYPLVNQIVRDRVLKMDARYFLGSDFVNPAQPGAETVLGILGTYQSGRFQNGKPNAINLILWYVVFSDFGDDLGALCAGQGDLNGQVAERFQEQVLKPLCAWPAASARNEEALRAFWAALMGADAPPSEFLAWRDFFLGPHYEQAAAPEAISAMAQAILNNPHFLLRK